MGLRGLPLLPLMTLALCMCAPAATASVLAGEAEGPAVTDGRTVAFSPRLGAIGVVTGGAVRDVDVEPTCGQAPVQVYAIGAGQVLYGCGAGTSALPHRLDLASGETYPVPGAAEVIAANAEAVAPYGVSFDGIGAVGVSFLSSGYHWGVRGALDWRTGAYVPESRDATEAVDLDRSGLTTTLCTPLRKEVTPEGSETAFWPFQYREPFGLSWGERLTLRRCGSARRVVLSHDAFAPQLGTRLATWTDTRARRGRYRVYAYALGCGRRMSWPAAYYSRVAPLARSVVISESVKYDGPWRIRQVSARGICWHAVARR